MKTKTHKTNWPERVRKLIGWAGGVENLAVLVGASYFTVIRWRSGTHRPGKIAQKVLDGLARKSRSARKEPKWTSSALERR